ncbi:MAG: cbb3-type cytochrome oxidase assembly protein CcoS [Chitinophagaceae bacterium]|nr:MAG: cbb3-type cytochrome oxidase assembly protein CcoS [Chitinophagaceae bacterium]
MSVLIILIVVSVLVAGTFLTLFVLSVKKGQYDDDYTPSVRMLFDDMPPPSQTAQNLSKPI